MKMWLYPWLTWLVIGFICFVLVVMLFRPAQQLEVISTGLLGLGIIGTVPIMSRWKKLIRWQKAPCKTYVSYSRRQPSFSGVKDDRPFPTDGHRWLSLA